MFKTVRFRWRRRMNQLIINRTAINLFKTLPKYVRHITGEKPFCALAKWKQPHAILTTSTVYLIIVIFIKASPSKGGTGAIVESKHEGVGGHL